MSKLNRARVTRTSWEQKLGLALLAGPVLWLLWWLGRTFLFHFPLSQASLTLFIGFLWLAWACQQHRRPNWGLALAFCVVGIVLHGFGWTQDHFTVMQWSLAFFLGTAVCIHGGLVALKNAWPGLLLVLLSIPPSAQFTLHWLRPITEPERVAVAFLGTGFLRMVGVPAWQDGTTITLLGRQGAFSLKVEMLCTGFANISALLAVAAPYYFVLPKERRKKLLFLLPLVSLTANTIRIILNGVVAAVFGNNIGFRFSHDYSGYAMLIFCGIALIAFERHFGVHIKYTNKPNSMFTRTKKHVALDELKDKVA